MLLLFPFEAILVEASLILLKSQSRLLLLNDLCCLQRLFPWTSDLILCWHLAMVKEVISVMCVSGISGFVACKY